MRYSLTYVQAKDGRETRFPHPGTLDAKEAARFVRRATMQNAEDSIARLDAGVPAVTVPYMDDPSAAVEVRVAS